MAPHGPKGGRQPPAPCGPRRPWLDIPPHIPESWPQPEPRRNPALSSADPLAVLPPAPPDPRPLLAAAWMSGAIVSFTLMAVAGRALAPVHDTFEILMWRSLMGFVVILAVGIALGRLHEIRHDRIGQHVLRNIVHFTGQNLWFWALTMIPMAQLFALEFTSPIWVIVLSPLLLGERITRIRALAAAIGFAGILVVVRPGFDGLNPGVLAAAGAAICFAAVIMATKALTRRESILSILFWLTLIQFFLGLLAAGWDGHITWPTAASLPWLAVVAGCGVVAHFCLTTALTLAPASVVAPLDFLRLPVIAVIGALFYAEPIDALVMVGAGLIFAGHWLNLRGGGNGGPDDGGADNGGGGPRGKDSA